MFSIYLLGPFDLQVDGRSGPPLRRKTRALLAYLAATPQTHHRPALAQLFCAEADAPVRALRLLLSRVRSQLGPEAILAEGDTVRLNHQAGRVDSCLFEQLLAGDLAGQSLESLGAAVDLYRGEFLAEFSLPDAPEFELWLLGEQARLRRLYERALLELIGRLAEAEKFEAAIQRARQLIHSNPLLEEAHARLVWLYARTGQREAALAQFEQCRLLLQRELAVEPAPELQALHDQIVAGHLRPVAKTTPAAGRDAAWLAAPDFVGRAAELEILRQAWAEAGWGEGAVILVEAEAGGGKTRLIEEFAGRLPGARFLAGHCHETTLALPYHPWIELLEKHLATLDEAGLGRLSPFSLEYLVRLLPALARQLGRLALPAAPITGDELERLFSALFEFLTHGLDRPGAAPLLLFIDDLQWADETSLRLFHFLARRASHTPLLLVGTVRPEEIEDNAAVQALLRDLGRGALQRLQLAPLAPADIAGLADYLWPELPQGYRPHVVALLAGATGGNPLFVTELLNELAHTREVPAELPVPASVRELTGRRLEQLPGGCRQVIEALVVFDGPTLFDEIRSVSGRSEEEMALAIDLGLRRGLLCLEAGRPLVDFRHDLIRQAVAGP
ncbi:MAG: AAA family ATPase, partial [Chloroflexi bacterium]|nr:AAA family ATPase [Chloroflexota bacterium]